MSNMKQQRNGDGLDPTENVKALMAAALESLTQLRLVDVKFNDAAHAHLKEVADLRALHAAAISDLRERHNHAARTAESERLNSIRQVDREDVNKTASQALQAIQTLATITNTTAETLRTQVATTAQAAATQLATITGEINKRISALELASSEGKGKEKIADPMMASLVEEMKKTTALLATGSGKSEGISWVGALILGALSVLGAVLGIGGVIYTLIKP